MKRFSSPIVSSILLILVFLICFSPFKQASQLTGDAHSYWSFSTALMSGALFEIREAEDVPIPWAILTPGYPLLIATARALRGSNPDAVLQMHVIVGVVAMLAAAFLLRSYVLPLFGGVVFTLSYWVLAHDWYHHVLPEWTSYLLLLLLFACMVRHAEGSSLRTLFALALLCSLSILVRPSLLVCLWIPFVFGVVFRVSSLARCLVVVLAGLAPLLLWMGFNYYRLGVFSVTPFAGYNTFGVASLIGYAEAETDDEEELVEFISEINKRKKPAPGEILPLDKLYDMSEDYWRYYNYNIWKVGGRIHAEQGLSVPKTNRFFLTYSWRVLCSDFDRYLYYIAQGMKRHIHLLWLLIPCLLVPLIWLYRKENQPLAYAVLSMLVLHLLHSFLCASIEILQWRYYAQTFFPLIAISALVILIYTTQLQKSPK